MSSPETLLILPLPELFRDDVFRIEPRRLWLRWLAPGDATRLHEIAASETAARGTGAVPHPLLAGDAVERIGSARAANAAGSGQRAGARVVVEGASGRDDRAGQPRGQRRLHNFGRCDEWNLCLTARTVVRANQEPE